MRESAAPLAWRIGCQQIRNKARELRSPPWMLPRRLGRKIKASFRCLELWGKKKQERKRCNFPDKQHFVQLRRASDSMTRPTGWMEFSLALQTLKVALTHAVATIKVLTYKLQVPQVIKPPQRVPCHTTSAPHQSTQRKLIPTIPE